MSLLIPREAELYRVQLPGYPIGDHKSGAFSFRDGLGCIVSAGEGWEHVSVSRKSRCPSWEDMCRIKELFWDDEDCVMQLHPPKSEYVNYHQYTLHLWRPIDGQKIPRPPAIMVGPPT